jgi:Ni/Co efflux regulator RcnB
MPRPAPLALAALLGLAACATDPTQGPNPNANQTVMTGAAAGAALGALIGLAAGGRDNRGGGAALGALLGAAAGGLAGAAVQGQNQRFARTEQNLDRQIVAAENDAAEWRRAADASARIRSANERRLAQLEGRYRTGQISLAQYRREVGEIREDLGKLRESAGQARAASGEIADASRVGGKGGAALAGSAEEIARAEAQIRANADALARALAGAPG